MQEVGGGRCKDVETVQRRVRGAKPGSALACKLTRAGKAKTTSVTVGEVQRMLAELRRTLRQRPVAQPRHSGGFGGPQFRTIVLP